MKLTELITAIHALYIRLHAGEVAAWRELETLCMQAPAESAPAVLASPRIQSLLPALRALRAAHEYEQEKTAALHLLQQRDPTAAFRAFENYERYVRIAALEMSLVRAFQPAAPLTALFIGSGPLPISALLLAEHWDCRVDCLDHNREAYELGAAVAQALGLADRLHFRCADVFDVTDLARYDVIFVAALVGITEKARVVQHLSQQLRAGQVLALRAGRDLRTLFYADIAASDLRGFKIHTAAVTGAAQLEIVACKREGIAF